MYYILTLIVFCLDGKYEKNSTNIYVILNRWVDKKKQQVSHQVIITDIFHLTQYDSCLCLILVIVFNCIMSACEHICLDLVVHISQYGTLRVYSYVWKNMIMCMFLCACMHAWGKRALCCMSECTFSVSLRGCVCAHVCLNDGGGGRAGIKHTRSTSQRLGGPSPALMATHVNPTTQKIGQWNTTHTHRHIYIHTHAPVSTQRITVCQSRQCLVARLRPTFNTATHIYPRNRHVLWTGTTGLRAGQRGIATVTPPPSLTLWPPPLCMLPHIHAKKTSTLMLLGSCSCQRRSSCKDYTGCGFNSTPHNSSSEKNTHWEK